MFVHLCSINTRQETVGAGATLSREQMCLGVRLGSGHYALGTPGAALHGPDESALARGFGEQGGQEEKDHCLREEISPSTLRGCVSRGCSGVTCPG